MHLSIISATSGISRFRYTFVALVDDKEHLPAKIAEYIIINKIVLNWNREKGRHVLMRMNLIVLKMNKFEYKKFIISDYISHYKIYGLRLVTNILINLIAVLSTLKLIVGNII